MNAINVDADRFVELLEMEHARELDRLGADNEDLRGELKTANDLFAQTLKSVATCSCGHMKKTHLVFIEFVIGHGGGYYQCPECKKKWTLTLLEDQDG